MPALRLSITLLLRSASSPKPPPPKPLLVIPAGSSVQAANEDRQKRIARSRLEVMENADYEELSA